MNNNNKHNNNNIEILNKRFGHKDRICVVGAGDDGQMTKIILRNASGSSSVEVFEHGAHITSFKTRKDAHNNRQQQQPDEEEEVEVLYMSKRAVIGKGSKIRGGIPICFPQFGQSGPMVQHGFARQSDEWKITRTMVDEEEGTSSVVLTLNDTYETRQMWNQNHFQADYIISVTDKDELIVDFRVKNLNQNDALSFTCALHTYFNVDHIDKTGIRGLHNLQYVDKVPKANNALVQQSEEIVTFSEEVDRVYQSLTQAKTSELHILFNHQEKQEGGGIKVTLPYNNDHPQNGFKDCVVWNPWIEKTKGLQDMDDSDYLKFVCVEAAVVKNPVHLSAQQSWQGQMVVSGLSDR